MTTNDILNKLCGWTRVIIRRHTEGEPETLLDGRGSAWGDIPFDLAPILDEEPAVLEVEDGALVIYLNKGGK